MLRERSIQRAYEERRQRRALLIFTLALCALLAVCALVGTQMLVRPSPLIPVGRVEEYTDDQPRRHAVSQLELSKLIVRRDSMLSEDVLFVRRTKDGSWVALLGVDTLSGCFLYWDQTVALYKDISCLGASYTIDGVYHGGLTSGEQPQPMARLPVEIHDGAVFVRDELLRVGQ